MGGYIGIYLGLIVSDRGVDNNVVSGKPVDGGGDAVSVSISSQK